MRQLKLISLLIEFYVSLLISRVVIWIKICIRNTDKSSKNLKTFETVMLEIMKSFTFKESDVLILRYSNDENIIIVDFFFYIINISFKVLYKIFFYIYLFKTISIGFLVFLFRKSIYINNDRVSNNCRNFYFLSFLESYKERIIRSHTFDETHP